MDFSLTRTFRSPEFSPLCRNCDKRTIFRRNLNPKPIFSRTHLTIMAKKVSIEGVSDDLNAIASRNLDFAHTRRRVRLAFAEVQLQLDHCLFKMAPTGIRTEEWYEKNSKGLEIFCKSWLPKSDAQIKAALCFCHGYGDTCTFFFEGIARHIAGSGYAVYAIDHPGFGLSEGLHGYIPSFDDIADNAIEQFTKIKGRPEVKGLPRFLLGQSMGGAVALKVHLKERREWDGMVLVAPMCKFREGKEIKREANSLVLKIAEDVTPSKPVLNVITLLANIIPKAKLVPQKDLAELAFRELEKRRMAPYNVICYNDQLRLKTAVELLKATSDIDSQVEKVSSPLLILHGSADKLTDPAVSKFLYDRASSKDKTLKLYEDGYHCILEGEPDERIFTVLNDIISWLDSRCSLK